MHVLKLRGRFLLVKPQYPKDFYQKKKQKQKTDASEKIFAYRTFLINGDIILKAYYC